MKRAAPQQRLGLWCCIGLCAALVAACSSGPETSGSAATGASGTGAGGGATVSSSGTGSGGHGGAASTGTGGDGGNGGASTGTGGSGGNGTSTGNGGNGGAATGTGGASTGGAGGIGGMSASTGVGRVCTPGDLQACYSGPAGTENVGLCKGGSQVCDEIGSGWGPCTGDVLPVPETCDTPEDDDCNGQVNEGGTNCVCLPSSTSSCYTGPAGTVGVGACVAGTQTCNALGTGYGACVGEVIPLPETCNTPVDDDCNGQTNESGQGCACIPNMVVSCYSGPAGTLNVGACVAGAMTCNALGTAYGPCVGEVVPQPETCNTPVDDDCNGQTNESGAGCVCPPSSSVLCYSGPAGTVGIGACKAGAALCNAQGTSLGPCVGEVVPVAETCNTPIDDNCNGQVNEGGAGCVCSPNSTASCYSGPAGTQGVGICQAGTKTCNAQGTAYGACVGEVDPQASESCATTVDDNCNGQVNEGCACAPNSTASCYSGPAGTAGVGLCHAGTHTCNAQGTAYGACVGEVDPTTESCLTAGDDNCNGQTNEGCICSPSSTASCYSGPAGTQGVGICQAGTKTCNAQGTAYGACVGEVDPQAESCLTAGDDNCNGQTNEGCICAPNSTASCYSGPAGTQGVGICQAGTHTCNAAGTAYGSCVGEVLPGVETCNTPVDDNCNGQVNESGAGCVCLPNATVSCYSGPAGTAGVGLCHAGTALCNGQGTAVGACSGEVDPTTESCLTPGDDNCNGQANEGCTCTPNTTIGCYTGPAGTSGVGVCQPGTQTCNAQGTGYGACTGQVLPALENCNTAPDEDCSGTGCVGPSLLSKEYGSATDDEGFAVAVDASGNVYVGGYMTGTSDFGCGPLSAPTAQDAALLIKLGPTGNCLWNKAMGGTAHLDGLGVDSAGNVYVTGFFLGGTIDLGGGALTPAASDIFLAKYDTNGVYKWGKKVGDNQQQQATGLVVDAAGNVYTTGWFFGTIDFGGNPMTTAGAQDVYLAKLTSSGVLVWSKKFGDASAQIGNGVAVDASGNVALIGSFQGTINLGGATLTGAGLNDAFVARFTGAGVHVWSKSFGDAADQTGVGVAIDASYVYATGAFAGTVDFGGGAVTSQGGSDAYLLKLGAGGALAWSVLPGGANTQNGVAVTVDWSGSVGLTAALNGSADFGGGVFNSSGSADIVVAKYTSAGAHLWSKRFGNAGNETPRYMTVDASGNLFVTGLVTSQVDFGGGLLPWGGGEDVFVAEFGP